MQESGLFFKNCGTFNKIKIKKSSQINQYQTIAFLFKFKNLSEKIENNSPVFRIPDFIPDNSTRFYDKKPILDSK